MKQQKTLILFNYDWDQIAFGALKRQWPQSSRGFDLFTFPSNARLAWFDMERFVNISAWQAKLTGAKAVVSNHEQFGALCAALLAEKMGWPGTPVNAVLACQHKLHARRVLEEVAPEATVPALRVEAAYGGPIPDGLPYPGYVKPVKAAFSVLARQVNNQDELHRHTRFGPWELWVIRHLVEPFEREVKLRLPQAGTAHSLMLEQPVNARQYCLDGYVFNNEMHPLGIVDSVMYPGTDAFMRFDYPSQLASTTQAKAADVARRFLQKVGFTHGLFNMEFFHDEGTDKLTVIEFNPRMASQFSDLYSRVDGINLHEIALMLAHGQNPEQAARKKPKAGMASSLVYRALRPQDHPPFPDHVQMAAFRKQFPDALFFEFKKKPGQVERDFKWLRSYRYGIVHLDGKDRLDLFKNAQAASDVLGWPAPLSLTERALLSGESLAAKVA